MATVTALEPQIRNTERVNLHLDGDFAFGLAASVVLSRGIRIGDVLDDAEVQSLQTDEEMHGAHTAALNFLSFRPRASREIEMYLRKRGVDSREIVVVIERLVAAGLLDDREFARFWVDNRQNFRPRGARALKAEMRQKGLGDEVIDEALEGLPDEENAAYEACATKLRTFEKFDEREFYQKLLAFLQRRGFPFSAASAAAKRRLAEKAGSADIDGI